MPSADAPSRIIALETTASTNADAMRLAINGGTLPFWVIADKQTAGRGRSGRTWQSLPGNLHATFAIAVTTDLATLPQLALVAGVALHDTVADLLKVKPGGLRLKWPNDLLISGQKIGGILLESTSLNGPSPITLAIIGFGLNVAAHPEITGRPVTSIAAHLSAAPPTPRDVLAVLDGNLKRWLGLFTADGGPQEIRSNWLARAGAIGEPIKINGRSGEITGTFAGLDGTGALLLAASNGRIETFTYGDVTILDTSPAR